MKIYDVNIKKEIGKSIALSFIFHECFLCSIFYHTRNIAGVGGDTLILK